MCPECVHGWPDDELEGADDARVVRGTHGGDATKIGACGLGSRDVAKLARIGHVVCFYVASVNCQTIQTIGLIRMNQNRLRTL